MKNLFKLVSANGNPAKILYIDKISNNAKCSHLDLLDLIHEPENPKNKKGEYKDMMTGKQTIEQAEETLSSICEKLMNYNFNTQEKEIDSYIQELLDSNIISAEPFGMGATEYKIDGKTVFLVRTFPNSAEK